jgi:hypothetical protein
MRGSYTSSEHFRFSQTGLVDGEVTKTIVFFLFITRGNAEGSPSHCLGTEKGKHPTYPLRWHTIVSHNMPRLLRQKVPQEANNRAREPRRTQICQTTMSP